MNEKELILRAFELLLNVTPFSFDCGDLCDKACCSGDGEVKLLPKEHELFTDVSGFSYNKGNLVCSTNCSENRGVRPFYCRIFPLLPLVKKENGALIIKLVFDPQGENICPIIKENLKTDFLFKRAVRRAVRLLCRSELFLEHFIKESEYYFEMQDFKARIMR